VVAVTHGRATCIPVKGFSTTLFWPLILDSACEPGERAKVVQRQIRCLLRDRAWQSVDDLLHHIGPPRAADANVDDIRHSYAELTYFHEFVQHFLFSRRGATGPLKLFRRTDIPRVDVVFTLESQTIVYGMAIERMNLYVLDSLGVALLTLSLRSELGDSGTASLRFGGTDAADGAVHGNFDKLATRPLMLADVQRFNDGFRRAHAPFLVIDKPHRLVPPVRDGYVPRAVRWHGTSSTDLLPQTGASESATVARELRRGTGPRSVPPFAHFAGLLKGWRIAPRGAEGDTWRHMADDRLHLLSRITLPDQAAYAAISDGDWARLCFVDAPGNDPWPYASTFLCAEQDRHYYDRFHYDPGESSHSPSRYLVCGYALLAVGCGWFFEEHVTEHMHRHYYQLMLLAQIERVALLAISGQISRAVRRHESDGGSALEKLARFEARLQATEQDFLQFVHRFRFTGVSDQMQPTEMFAMLRRNMHLPELYADIKDELTTATDFLAMQNQQRQTASATRLSVVATFGVILGLAFALLGINILNAEDVRDLLGLVTEGAAGGADAAAALGILALTVGLSFLLGLAVAKLAIPRGLAGHEDPLGARLRGLMLWCGGFALLAGFGLLAVAVWPPLWAGSAVVAALLLGAVINAAVRR
jgi:hypothetical protein